MSYTAEVTIKGISPLLMHSFPMVPIEAMEKKNAQEQAKYAEYRSPDGKLYLPGMAIQRAMIGAATYSKGKGRGSLQKPVAACLLVDPEYCVLDQQEYIVDSRPVVVPATRGRVVRHRPRFNEWSTKFKMMWDENLLTENQVRRVIDDCGCRVGLLDFRPEKKGPFGRFMVTSWVAEKN
jgi:hypothetical protein